MPVSKRFDVSSWERPESTGECPDQYSHHDANGSADSQHRCSGKTRADHELTFGTDVKKPCFESKEYGYTQDQERRHFADSSAQGARGTY